MAGNSVILSGPLFEGVAGEATQRFVEDTVRELTELGMQHLTSPMPDGVPALTGNYRRNINPTINGASAQIDDSDVIYGPWLEGTGSRNQTTRFKGYSTFRRANQWLQDQVPEVAQKYAEVLVKELGG